MISPTRQRFAMAGMLAVALMALVLGAIYQDDTKLDDGPTIVGADALDPGTGGTGDAAASGGGSPATTAAQTGGPIEAWLPRSGEASACSEPVGVDLAPGYGAELTINGQEIAAEDMNVNLDDAGKITNEITASRSLGQYSFEPEDDCPNGARLRPLGNVLEVCVYRLSDNSRRCVLRTEHSFDAL